MWLCLGVAITRSQQSSRVTRIRSRSQGPSRVVALQLDRDLLQLHCMAVPAPRQLRQGQECVTFSLHPDHTRRTRDADRYKGQARLSASAWSVDHPCDGAACQRPSRLPPEQRLGEAYDRSQLRCAQQVSARAVEDASQIRQPWKLGGRQFPASWLPRTARMRQALSRFCGRVTARLGIAPLDF